MSGRMFLNVVSQLKETTPVHIGVIDSEGTVIACTDLQEVGRKWPHLAEPINDAGEAIEVSVDAPEEG